ncbi:small nuclear ribonucleoprotein E-like isoform X1 [Brassica napus]|uniref:small nuclear ribonucleoprotein E-like isoform X1 n=1 Tax=Brassica napus TaxID=3708 RepID=UPI00207A2F77|nr:small nuclear ribonucleoprotein E-like isoform X1 [Brassica napus]
MASTKVQRIMTQPIVRASSLLLFRLLSLSLFVLLLIFPFVFSRWYRRRIQNLIFRFLQSKARIQIWLFEQKDLRIEGRITGFDEYMNLVLDEAEEVSIKKNTRKQLGRILLKGDNITLMMNTGK